MFQGLKKTFTTDIGIDLGTTNTRVYLKEKGIVINEPSVVAVNTRTEQIVAVGAEAKGMLGKTPGHIQVTRPLATGIISDYEVTERMLRYFLDKVHEGGVSFMRRPRVVVSIPLEVTEVETKAVEDAVIAAGARTVHLVHSPMAAAVGMHMPIQDPVGSMMVDIGGGKTDVAVLSLSGVVAWRSTPIAGDELNRNIIQFARDAFNLLIGEGYAEQIKTKIGSAVPQKDMLEFPMRGRDVVTGLPKELMITNEHIREAIERSVKTIADHIKMTLEVTPPELTADIHERGILLSGGTALLKGLCDVIAQTTEIPVRVADDPETAVVRGAGYLLEDDGLLGEISLPSARDVA